MPINGYQSLSQETDDNHVRKGDIGGFCVAWCLWFFELYIRNNNTKINLHDLVHKSIKRLINSNYLINEHIRNYANYLYKSSIKFLTDNNFKYNILFYKKLSDNEINLLYDFINNYLSN
jgi:hypothetical protein